MALLQVSSQRTGPASQSIRCLRSGSHRRQGQNSACSHPDVRELSHLKVVGVAVRDAGWATGDHNVPCHGKLRATEVCDCTAVQGSGVKDRRNGPSELARTTGESGSGEIVYRCSSREMRSFTSSAFSSRSRGASRCFLTCWQELSKQHEHDD
jgi:hypothetical protein